MGTVLNENVATPASPSVQTAPANALAALLIEIQKIPLSSDPVKYLAKVEPKLTDLHKEFGYVNAKYKAFIQSGGSTPSPMLDLMILAGLLGILSTCMDVLRGKDRLAMVQVVIMKKDLGTMVDEMKQLENIVS